EVAPVVRARVLDREEIRWRLEHADLRAVAVRAAAEAANGLLRQHAALLAVTDLVRRRFERTREPPRRLAVAVEQMERHPLRGLLPDARQALQCLDQVGEQRRVDVRHDPLDAAPGLVRTAALT